MATDLTDLLASHGLLLAACVAGVAVLLNIRVRRQRRRSLEDTLTRLSDLQGLISTYGQSLISMEAAVTRLERRINEFTDRNLEIQSQFGFNRAFEEASRMARDGGSVESLVSECGLTAAEAALMIRLHQEKERPQDSMTPHSMRPPAPRLETAPAPTADEDGPLAEEEIRLREVLRAAHRA